MATEKLSRQENPRSRRENGGYHVTSRMLGAGTEDIYPTMRMSREDRYAALAAMALPRENPVQNTVPQEYGVDLADSQTNQPPQPV